MPADQVGAGPSGLRDKVQLDIDRQCTDAYQYRERGHARHQAGDLSRAEQDFSTAIDLNPEYSEALLARAALRREAGDVQGAVDDVNRAVKLEGTHFQETHIVLECIAGKRCCTMGDERPERPVVAEPVLQPTTGRWSLMQGAGAQLATIGTGVGAVCAAQEERFEHLAHDVAAVMTPRLQAAEATCFDASQQAYRRAQKTIAETDWSAAADSFFTGCAADIGKCKGGGAGAAEVAGSWFSACTRAPALCMTVEDESSPRALRS